MPSSHPLAAEVARLYIGGLGCHAIAQRLKIGHMTVRRIRNAAGIPAKPSGNRRLSSPEALQAAAERYRKGGITLIACEDEFGLPRQVLRNYLSKLRREEECPADEPSDADLDAACLEMRQRTEALIAAYNRRRKLAGGIVPAAIGT